MLKRVNRNIIRVEVDNMLLSYKEWKQIMIAKDTEFKQLPFADKWEFYEAYCERAVKIA